MRPSPKSIAVGLALLLGLASILVTARPVSAAQNRPTWTEGDFWVYSRTQGSATSTIRVEVHEKTTLTLSSGTYTVFHVTTTTTNATGSSTTVHSWIQDSNLGVAKANFTVPFFGDAQVTFDPPVAQAVFPLSVNAQWSLNATVRVVGISFSFNLAYSGTVIAERSTTVAAGTFNVAVIRTPSTGTAHDEDHYSDGPGNSVRRESYDNSNNRVADQHLTSYRYQSGTLALLLIVVGGVVLAIVAIAIIVALRRRRSRMPPGMYPPQAPPEAPPPPSM